MKPAAECLTSLPLFPLFAQHPNALEAGSAGTPQDQAIRSQGLSAIPAHLAGDLCLGWAPVLCPVLAGPVPIRRPSGLGGLHGVGQMLACRLARGGVASICRWRHLAFHSFLSLPWYLCREPSRVQRICHLFKRSQMCTLAAAGGTRLVPAPACPTDVGHLPPPTYIISGPHFAAIRRYCPRTRRVQVVARYVLVGHDYGKI